MINKKNKSKIFKKLSSIITALLVAVLAFSLPFVAKFGSKIKSSSMIASADIYYNPFYNNLICPTVNQSFISANFNNLIYQQNITFNLTSSTSIDMYGESYLSVVGYQESYKYVQSLEKDSISCESQNSMQYLDILNSNNTNNSYFNFYLTYVNNEGYFYIPLLVYISENWLGDISLKGTSVVYGVKGDSFGSYPSVYDFSLNFDSYHTFFYKVILSNGAFIEVLAPCPVNSPVYQTTSTIGGFSYNGSYQDGYNSGLSDGEALGYNKGYNAGDSVGYSRGYNDGANSANNYTFFSLVSAVIDAPIQAFMGLFNFEILGINLAGFFTGLLTLAFIITIVRLIMP